MFVGREKELKQLFSSYSSRNKELGVIYEDIELEKQNLSIAMLKTNHICFIKQKRIAHMVIYVLFLTNLIN